MEDPGILTNQNSTINKVTSTHEENHRLKLKEHNATSMIKGNNIIRTPYRHPNHKRKYINQWKYQYYSRREPYKHPVSQKIELGWAYSFTIWQFCSTIRRSYQLKSSIITSSRMKNQNTILQARARNKSSISMPWGQSIFKGKAMLWT